MNRKNPILGKYWSYEEYLQSPEWKARKKSHNIGRKECFVCKTTKKLNLHHKTYSRIGNEWPIDLVWLCEHHHLQVHDEAKKNKWRLYDAHIKLRKKLKHKIQRQEKIKKPVVEITPDQHIELSIARCRKYLSYRKMKKAKKKQLKMEKRLKRMRAAGFI